MDGYRLQLASDVHQRDGLGLELLSEEGDYLAEVFRHDDKSALKTVRVFTTRDLPLAVWKWFLDQSETDLAT